ncbi:MAG: Calx-beta domain-containing protein, partial [Microcystis panniformis]
NRTGGSDGQVGATIALSDGTAKRPNDYPNNSIPVIFNNGETSKTITIPIVDDLQFESNETLNLTLTNATGSATIGTQNKATLTIIDNEINQGITLDEGQTKLINNTVLKAVEANKTPTDIIYTLTDLPDNGQLILNTQVSGNALAFDGNNDYVAVANPIYLSSDYTIEGWFKKEQNQKDQTLISLRSDSISSKHYALIEIEQNETLRFLHRVPAGIDGGVNIFSSPINNNQWHHFAATKNQSQLKLYIDGIESGTASSSLSINDNTFLWFGFLGLNTPYRYFKGNLDDIQIWNKARTEAEIQADMNRQLTGNESGLVGYWNFNEGTGNIVTDSTNNHNNGTVYGATWTTGIVPTSKTLKLGDTFTQADIDNGLLTYQHNGSETTSDNFKFTVTDGTTTSSETAFNITINNVNEAPTAIQLSKTTIEENSPNSTVIGTLNTTDPDVNDTFTYSLVDNAGGRFAINSNQLIVADGTKLDYETNQKHTITIRTRDQGGLTYDKSFDINLIDVYEAGILAFSNASYSINENGTPVTEIKIIRTGGSDGEVSATIDLTDGTATADDYDKTSIPVTFANGETEKTINIPIKNDTIYEPNETFTIKLTNPTGGAILGNRNSATVTIINDDFPNLSVSSITPPLEGWSGQPIEITWTVLNNSTVATQGTWVDRVYLSDDSQFGNDIYLGELASPINLDGGKSYQRSHIFNLPNGISGNYQIITVTDAKGTIPEADESDNTTLSSVFPIHLSPYADLQVTSVNVPTTAKAGQQATFNWTVTNAGTGATDTPTWYDRLYLSKDTTLSSGDIYLGQAVNPSYLANNESYAQSLTVTLPNSLDGQYYAIVNTDATNLQYEVNFEGNNTGTSLATVSVAAPPPPGFLHVANVSISPATGTIWSGQAVTVTWTVENTGDTIIPINPNFGFWDDGLALSQTPSWDGVNGIWLGGHQGYRREPLDVDESYTHQKTITLPQYLSGEWYIVAVPDTHYIAGGTGGIGSSNIPRDYGAKTIEITLPPQPDLQVTQVNADNTGNSGQPISVTWTVSNEGFGATGGTSWTDKVYLSADTIWQGSDTLLGTFTHYGRLESVTDYTRTESVTLPQNIQGNYYLIVRTDTENAIYEYTENYDAESNNINYDPTPIKVTLIPPPEPPQVDLQVKEIASLNPAFSGRTLDIRYTVANSGKDDLSSSQWQDRLILSADDSLATSNDNFLLATVNQSRGLAAGDSYQQAKTVLLPVGISGNYHLFLTTDSNNSVKEPNAEGNNNASILLPITLTPPPDLEVTSLNTTPAWSGQELQVDWTVTNTGEGDTRTQETSWLDSLYLSENSSLDSGDRLLTQIRHNGSLNAGNSYDVTAKVTLALNLEGNYTLFLVTDRDNQVYEGGGENNNQTAIPLTISLSPQPDLEVTNINTTKALSGQNLQVNWTVTNTGQGDTRNGEIPWIDKLYLSEDSTLDGSDRLLSQITHNTVLKAGESYNATANATLPIGIEGNYTLFVLTDTGNIVYEKGGEDNNQTAIALPITLTPPPDLQVSQVDAPANAYASQPITINWTVTNEGEGITQSNTWYDSVYLSRDQFLDANVDLFLGSVKHQGEVASDGNYTASLTATLPPGISGPYYAFVVTDSTSKVFEAGADGNNTHFDGNATVIEIPPPADLQVTAITLPATGITGEPPTKPITWTVTNTGDATAVGTWYDAVYLSADGTWDLGDALIATVIHTGNIASQASYTASTNAILPGAIPGDYQVIVRSDIRNQVRETDDSNNRRASGETIKLDMAQLTYDVTTTANISNGSDRSYRLDTPAGQDIVLTADFNNPAQAEIYVRYGETPNRAEFDAVYSDPFQLQQEIALSNTRAGSYYVLVHGREGAGSNSSFNLTPAVLDFGVRSLSLSEGSNQGQVTVSLKGAKFTPETEISLISPDGAKTIAQRAWWRSNSEIWATFDLQGLDTGLYDIQVTDGEISASLEDSFTVTAGAVGHLEMEIIAPSAIRPGYQGTVTIEYENTGATDIVAPILALDADNARLRFLNGENWTEGQVYFLGINPEGPAGILSPGAKGSVSLVFAPLNTTDSIFFQLTTPQETNTIDWAALKEQAKPSTVGAEAWDVVWQQFSTSVGDTVADYQNVLAENATYLSQLGESSHDVSRLLRFEMLQSSNYGSQFQNYNLGSLGYGWSFPWDIQLTTDTKGNVTLYGAGFFRSFTKQANGSYQAQTGDYATLTQEGNTYRLEETDGIVSVFNSGGQLSYLEDSNSNRLTAVYTGNELSKLLHSNGDSFTFTYNNLGRIEQITDPAGRSTSYTYDTTGTNLLTVTSVDGTTAYTYNDDYSISSITYPDLTKTFFTYDSQGRLIKESSTGNAESVTYKYDTTGGVTVTDGTGAKTQLYFNDRGQLAQAYDALGRTVSLEYDNQGNLTGLISPNSSSSGFTYDNQGNLLSATDPLGQTVYFTYDSTADALKTVRDQRGNVTQYSYDSQRNLTAITYSNGSKETFNYDATGNPIQSVNRRSEPITYTYDTQGRLLRKNYSNGSFAQLTYDAHGNLLTAINNTGTTSFEYDNADRLTKTTYSTGRYVSFAYDSGGRRSQMTASDGLTVNYSYDTLGRLAGLADGNNNPTVSYTYNTAGYLTQETNGNGTYTTYNYDSTGQLISLVNYDDDHTVNSRYDYTYDQLGRRTSLTTLEGKTDYGYDAIGQLTSVSLPDGRTINYQYDAAGNRISVTDNSDITSYIANNLNQYTSVGGVSYSYDLDGNLIAKGNDTTYTYNTENRLIGVTNSGGVWTYEYDALGNRIASVHDGVKTEYLLDPTGLVDVIGEYDGSGGLIAHYVHGLGLVSRVDNSQVNYYDADAIGSIIGLTGADGEYVNRYQYLPFGEDLSKTETVANPFEYVGQWGVMDESNGLDFMRSRYYDKVIGKFSSIDPLGLASGDSNFYSYTSNAPLNQIDPEGNTPLVAAGAALGALAGMSTYVVGQVLSGQKTTLGGFAGSAVSGAITGGFLGATGGFGALGSVGLGGFSSAIGYRIEKAIDKKPIDLLDFTSTTILGTLPLGKAKVSKPTTWGLGSPGFKNTFWKNNKSGKFIWDDLTRSGIGNTIGSSSYEKIKSALPRDLAIPPNFPPESSDFPLPDPSTYIYINNTTANEDQNNLTFTVSIEGNHTNQITVKYKTVDDSAIAGEDYQKLEPGTLTFAPGKNVLPIIVPIIDDRKVEKLEKFQVVLSDAKGATITNGTGIGSIIDNDQLPIINIIDSRPVIEGDTAQFSVTLSEASNDRVSFGYYPNSISANSSGATAGQDFPFTAGSGIFDFNPHKPEQTVIETTAHVSINDDDEVEAIEYFTVNLSDVDGAEIGSGQAIGTIVDNDGGNVPILISINREYTFNEGQTAEFTVSLFNPSESEITSDITVDYAVTNGSADSNDYSLTSTSGKLTFKPGEETSLPIKVSIIDDKKVEVEEDFYVTLSNPQGAEILNATGIGKIRDNDRLPYLTISSGSGSESSGTGSLTVTLSESSQVEVKVDYFAIDETATSDIDYNFASPLQTLTFAPGTTSQTIPIKIYDDTIDEDTETFQVILINPQNAQIAVEKATGTIYDNDPNKRIVQPPPVDPNDIVGPAGYGDQNWINATQTLPYTIRFENKSDAQAPAHTVTITHPLDLDLDWRTFRIGSFGWGNLTITPSNSQPFYAQRIDLTKTQGYYVDISAGLKTQTGEAFWTFTTIDPETGESPTDPFLGFLPPNDENASGEGFVNYTIRPRSDASTGDIIDAAATIVFDTEEPIDTPPIFHTIDPVSPQSAVTALPATTSETSFTVTWTGTDGTAGAGLAKYTVYVSDNGGNFTSWLTNTSNTSAIYTGREGHTYRFYTTATDNVGNTEAIPTTADATIQILSSNQPPKIITNTGLTLDEGGTQTLGNSYLQVTDLDNTNSELVYTLTDLPTRGILTLNTQILALNGTFTQADIDNNRLTYTHNGSETTSDRFSFNVADGVGGSIASTTFNIVVNPVNDAPIANPDSYILDEDTTLTINAPGVKGNDTDAENDSLTVKLVSTV